MALTQVTGPYPIFTDLDGTPLDDGYLYIGEINEDPETNPILVYWDSALTIVATQPIRTSNGYAYRNGTPALLYTAGEFSITIRNKRQEFVLYSPLGYGFDPAAVSASVVKNDFIGDGVEVDFTLSASPSTKLATNIFINGVYQEKDSYSLLGNVITFSIAPPLNSSIEVMTNETGVINAGNATAISYTASFPGATAQTVQTKLEQYVSVKDFGAVGDGVADDTAAIQDALDSGAKLIYAPNGNYKLTGTLYIPEATTLKGAGKAASTLTCTSNFTPIVMQNANDAGFEGFLIIAHSTQTAALIALTANTQTIARCIIRDVQGSGSNTDFPFISVLTAGGAYGNWAHFIEDVSCSGCGTIFRAETTAVNSWINSIRMSHVYANDFIRGIQLIETLGDGASSCTFFDWAAQTSARTQYGALINNASVLGKQISNSFTDVRFYDLIPPAQEYFIGTNVLDTTIQGLSVDTLIPSRIEDEGVGTVVKGMSFPDYFTYNGRTINVPTNAGFTNAVTGTGTTQQLAPYFQLRTGATLGSLARLYTTEPVCGLSQNQIFNVDFGLPLKISFLLTRIGSGASSIGRFQLKTTQADGSLAAKGIGVQINNYAVVGESYGASGANINLGLTLDDAETYKFDIVHYPGVRIEWWVNGVLASKTSTVANIPTGNVTCYLQSSMSNVAADDVQLLISAIQLKSPNVIS